MGLAAPGQHLPYSERPNGWEPKTLSTIIASLEAGVSVRSAGDGAAAARSKFVLKTSAINNGRFIPDECKPVATDELHRVKLSPAANSILISRMNTPDLVGESGYVETDHPQLFLPDRLWMTRFHPDADINARWLAQLLSSVPLKAAIKGAATGTSGSMKNLSKRAFLSISIDVPPRPEQDAIAGVLRDADTALDALDALIEKKRGVKASAMEQLLTGRQRLAGFIGEWEKTSLGARGRVYGGLTGKSSEDFGHGNRLYVPFLNVMNNVTVDPDQLERVRVSEVERQNVVRRGDLLFNTSSETPDEVGMCAAVSEDLGETYLNSFCFGFRPTRSTDEPLFLAYFFRGIPGRKLMSSLAQGSTRYNLSTRTFLGQPIALPSCREQQAIAGVLSDIDANIAALEAQRDKIIQIREGMMHELLTGRTRLV